MKFTPTSIPGAFLIEQTPHGDDRGFFGRAWCSEEFQAHGLNGMFVQCNDSFSAVRGTLRGLHYQAAPHGEAKLMRCIRGAIFDVILDLRHESSTRHRWFGARLSAENRHMLYVPEGCAHGYLTLEDNTEVLYPVTHTYAPAAERGVRWNDPAFDIEWPNVGTLVISAKDRSWPDYRPDTA
jgi:dTDP-4-dehydrorhamnose 3,5-epimerase